MIVSGGENVYPSAVENALGEHPDVADHAVIGVPDEDFGQRLVAFVVPRPGADIDEAKLRSSLKDKVSRFEQPRDVICRRRDPAQSHRQGAAKRTADMSGDAAGAGAS